MTVESFNESVNADIRRMTNKAELPTSFSDWLASNNDSIDLSENVGDGYERFNVEQTEATTKWFDEKAEHENDLRQESIRDYESDQLAGNPPEQGE